MLAFLRRWVRRLRRRVASGRVLRALADADRRQSDDDARRALHDELIVSTIFVLVPEEILTHKATWPGAAPQELLRADMVYFETPGGGAVFSVGSITFCGSLLHRGGENDISRILENVVRRFLAA